MRKLLLFLLINILFGYSFSTYTCYAQRPHRRMIVRFKNGRNKHTVEDRRMFIRNSGGDIHHSFHLLPIVSARLSDNTVTSLRNHPDIAYVEEDIIVHALAQEIPWGVELINANQIWSTNKGNGVDVAILDTGIDFDHPDLIDNIAGGIDYTGRWGRDGSTSRFRWNDRNGHGSHCAGTVAAMDNDIGFVGVAPEANLWAVKVLRNDGIGYTSDIIQGLQWCADNGIEIASMSFGAEESSQSLEDACDEAYNAGVFLVAAAGNGGPVYYPAAYDSVVAVSATDTDNSIAGFSSSGPEVEFSAPGINISSTYSDGRYAIGDGTSFACPHVAGVAALVYSASELGITSPSDIRTRLRETATDLGDAGKDDLYGYGQVDAIAATIQEPVLETIEIQPDSVTLYTGQNQQFDAYGWDQYGDSIDTGEITWTISDSSVGSISTDGLFVADGDPGTTIIQATEDGGVFGTASVTVLAAPVLTYIDIIPETVTLDIGQTQQFDAYGWDQYNDSIDTGEITWTISDSSVGSISTDGLFVADGDPGTTTIQATGGGVSGTASVTVLAAPVLTYIDISPETVTLDIGQTQQFTAYGRDQYDNPIDIDSLIWDIEDDNVGTISSNGLFEANSSGNTNIHAASSGIVGTATVTVNAEEPLPDNETFSYSGYVLPRDESIHTITLSESAIIYIKLTWNSNRDLRLRIYDSSGDIIAEKDRSNWRNRFEEILIELPAGEWDIAVVSDTRRWSIKYTLEGTIEY